MSDKPDSNLEGLDIDLVRRIDAICRRFEAEWRAGRQPRLEDYLGEVPDGAGPRYGPSWKPCSPSYGRRSRHSNRSRRQRDPSPSTIAEAPTIAPARGLPSRYRARPPLLSTRRHRPPRSPDQSPPSPTAAVLGDSRPTRQSEPTRIRYFGDYEIIRELARGGMGVVFEAKQVSLNRKVALKMILAGQLANDTEVSRFYSEAEAAADLDHPGIVPIFEVGQHEGQHYFSMGFIEGQSLSQRLAQGPLSVREAAELIRRVSEAIEYAHQRGVIHRDLKPANVLLDQNGNPRVTDFGLAKRVQVESGLTGSGQIMGTPSYMPPEQAGGKRGGVGPAADVYSLGATLYALVTGRPPFQAATAMDTVLMVIGEEPVSPRRLNASIPRDLETICLKCLEKEPGRRYTSAAFLAEDLRRFLAGEPILARPVGSMERLRKWARRRPAAAALVSVSSLTFIAFFTGGFLYSAQLRDFNTRLQGALDDVKQSGTRPKLSAGARWTRSDWPCDKNRPRAALCTRHT